MDTGTRLSDQEGYGLNERWKARYGVGDVTRFQGLMDAGCMDGKRRSVSVRGV
jgi:hypothetical protein